MPGPSLSSLARAVLPLRVRHYLRRAAREAPHRLRDLPKDAASVFLPRAFGGPMPPPGLRARVGIGSRAEFALVGREGARAVRDAVRRAEPGRPPGDWLDFGCGCGRIARYLLDSGAVGTYCGVDVDARQIAWARRRLAGRFSVIRARPPLDFPDAAFDVVVAVSVFTHFSEEEQFAWLAEIRRVLRPRGLLVATTLPPDYAAGCPGLTAEELASLARSGFLAADHGATTFNERSTFHSRQYLEKAWSGAFRLRVHEPRSFVGYQDLAVWEKPAPG